mmetsp:Transcript_90120/g.165390  ORF Transcript_90120/g.165390 Transcript_90120/m.165390 type:complete len:94 (+) Transcript_90120:50-331(+)
MFWVASSTQKDTRGVLLWKPRQFSPKKLARGLWKSMFEGVLQAACDGVPNLVDPDPDGNCTCSEWLTHASAILSWDAKQQLHKKECLLQLADA